MPQGIPLAGIRTAAGSALMASSAPGPRGHDPPLVPALLQVADPARQRQGVLDRRRQRLVAADQPMELVVEDLSHTRFQREPLLVRPYGVGPLDAFGQLQPRRAPLGVDL